MQWMHAKQAAHGGTEPWFSDRLTTVHVIFVNVEVNFQFLQLLKLKSRMAAANV